MRLAASLFAALLVAACAPTGESVKPTQSDQQSARNRARVHAELGAAYYSVGRYDVAITELKEALDADPAYVPALNQLALVHLALGQQPQAMTLLERALKLAPADSSVNNNYGMILCQSGREEQGLKHLRKVLADPLYAAPEIAHVNAGLCFKNSGDLVQAEAMLRRALALSPNQPVALYHLADVAFLKGDLLTARDWITRHTRATQADAEALWLAARIESRLGDRNALAAYGAQLNRRFPDAAQTRAFNEGRFQ